MHLNPAIHPLLLALLVFIHEEIPLYEREHLSLHLRQIFT